MKVCKHIPGTSGRHSSSIPSHIPVYTGRSYSLDVDCGPTSKRKMFSTDSAATAVDIESLPIKTKIFVKLMDSYVDSETSTTPTTEYMKDIIFKRRNEPQIVELILRKAFEFQKRRPEFKGLVDRDCILLAIENALRLRPDFRIRCIHAENILRMAWEHEVRLEPRLAAYVMMEWAKRGTPEALERLLGLLSTLEDRRSSGTDIQPLDLLDSLPELSYRTYVIVMKAYYKARATVDAVENCWTIIARMFEFSKRVQDNNLLPNAMNYIILLKVVTLCEPPEMATEVRKIVESMNHNERYQGLLPESRLSVQALAIEALSKFRDPLTVEKAQQIFDEIDRPSIDLRRSMLIIYARHRRVEEALSFLELMQRENGAERIKNYQDEMYDCIQASYNTLLREMAKSEHVDDIQMAERIVKSASQPNAETYHLFLSMLAYHGHADKALALVQHMQDDYASGRNEMCQPVTRTYNILLTAIDNAKANTEELLSRFEKVFQPASTLSNTFTCYTTLKFYLDAGRIDAALALFHKQWSDFDSRRNKHCRPDTRTYTALLTMLQQSDRSDAMTQAEMIFRTIPRPNQVAYQALLTMYADRGSASDAIELTRRMQNEFDSKQNRICRPDDVTEQALMTAIERSSEPDLLKAAKDVLNWYTKWWLINQKDKMKPRIKVT
jgi:pentatricopeptide repeat protein